MSISAISNAGRNLKDIYQSLSSGKRINQAKDDAAGLAIASKLQRQATTDSVRVQNAKMEQGQINIEEGSLSSVTDNLQRMKELSVQASNGLYSQSDRSAIQSEIDQLKQSLGSERLESLGLTDYDVTSGEFDMSDIDAAMDSVSASRSDLGARYNGLDHMTAYLSNSSLNLTAAQSRIEDLDFAKGVSDWKKEQTLYTYRIMMQKKQMENEDGRVLQLFGSN